MALRTPLTVSPHMYIGDSTGRPLDSGMVYFGLPDQDPEFYPIGIFSDDELTIPVSQPVRTKGGYLNDNKGDMAEIHAKELIYSVKVLDQYGRKIFYKGQSMRSNWNDDVIIRIDEAIMNTSAEAQLELKDAITKVQAETRDEARRVVDEALNTTVVDSGMGVSAQIVVDNGRTQREINADVAKITANTMVFLDAEKLGLVKTPEFLKPPYSTQQYDDAYNNGIKLAAAIHAANASGATEVVLETGNYPLLYSNLAGTTSFGSQVAIGAINLNGLNNLTVNLNDSVLYIVFDSANKNSYDKSPVSFKPWQLSGAAIVYNNCRGLTFRNGVLRGDQYARSFTDTNEKSTEQTYGIRSITNNRNSRFENMKFTGFRGDGIQGAPRGTSLAVNQLYEWLKGGLGATGEEIEEGGSYRTVKLDISDKTIIDNRVQLWSWSARLLAFRNSLLKVFFYGAGDVYLGQERVGQCEDIYLPKGCTALRFVALDDERITPTVNYTSLNYGIVLGTGMSYGFVIDGRCEFFENHRGGVSNLGGGSVFEKGCSFHDSGSMSKLGFPHYGDPTQYAINFEDTYTASLTVDGISVRDTPQGVLGNCRKFTVTNSHFKGMKYGCVNNYSCIIAKTSGNTFEDCGGDSNSATWFLTSDQSQADSYWDISNNNYIRSSLAIFTADKPKVYIDVINNRLSQGRFALKGFGDNCNAQGNTVRDIGGSGSIVNSLALSSLGINSGNVILGNIIPSSISFEFECFSKIASNNLIKLRAGNDQFNKVYPPKALERVKFNGVTLQSTTTSRANCNFGLNTRGVGFESHTDTIDVSDVIFDNVNHVANGVLTRDYCPSVFNIHNSTFKNGASIVLSIRETVGTSKAYVIKGVTFDVTNATKVFENVYLLLGTCTVSFIDCKFVSDTPKSIAIIQGVKTGITATAVGCQFINVTNTDGLLQAT